MGRDANEDGNDDRILVGGVPFATILHPNPAIGVPTRDFSEADAFDAWGKKLTYAVSELMTDAGYNENYGAIDIVDEHGQTILEVAQTAHTVIISHGPNGVGAFTADGQLTENCSLGITEDTDGDGEPDAQPGVPAAYTTNPDETENCDMNDARFMSGLYSERTSSFYDDMMTYQLIKSSSIWVPSGLVFDDNGTPGNPADDIEILQVSNTNPGNIGLGTQSPTEMLEVVGDIQAMQILADQYCDSAGQDCMSAEAIAGTGMTCPNGQVATGIENNSVRCAPAFSGPVVGTCPANQYMVGISNVTGVICESL